MSDILYRLAENRTPILLAEMGAYLHLIGRFSEKFIYAQAKDASEQEKEFANKEQFKKVCNDPDFFENTGLDKLLKDQSWETLINAFKSLSNVGELSNNKVESLSEFIEKHTWRDNPKGLCKILADSHGIVSGIDKALSGRGKSGKQKKARTFKATTFGYEKKQVKGEYIREVKKDFLQNLKKFWKI